MKTDEEKLAEFRQTKKNLQRDLRERSIYVSSTQVLIWRRSLKDINKLIALYEQKTKAKLPDIYPNVRRNNC